MKIFIDATMFLGMHSQNEQRRIATKNFFVTNYSKTIYMTLEDVGLCDDEVWQHERDIQDAYYPFMDRIHTLMQIERIPYATSNFTGDSKSELSLSEQLLCSTLENYDATLYTLNKNLLSLGDDRISALDTKIQNEIEFEPVLESCYKKSLELRVNTQH
jgi:hypothetical protein